MRSPRWKVWLSQPLKATGRTGRCAQCGNCAATSAVTCSTVTASRSLTSTLVEAWHQFDEIAGLVPVVELVGQDTFPGVAACTARAGQAEDEGGADKPRRRPRLQRT